MRQYFLVVDNLSNYDSLLNITNHRALKNLKSTFPRTFVFNSYEEAKQSLSDIHCYSKPGIIKFNLDISLDEDNLKASLYNYLEANDWQFIPHIESVFLKNHEINLKEAQNYENEHNKQLTNIHDLFLKMPLLAHFYAFNPTLYCLFFIDYQLFHEKFETWISYHNREPNCVANFFTAFMQAVVPFLQQTQKNQTLSFNFDFIKNLHSLLSKGILPDIQSGQIRTGYTNFGLAPSNTSLNGIKEILQEINQENDPEGFAIGVFIRPTLMTDLLRCWQISYAGSNIKRITIKTAKENFETASKNLLDLYVELKKIINCSHNEINHLINEIWKEIKDYLFNNQIENDIENDIGDFINIIGYLREQYQKTPGNAESIFFIEQARKNAIAGGGAKKFDLSQIDELSLQIFEKINFGENIHFFPPAASQIEFRVNKILMEFNNAINKTENIQDFINITILTIKKLERLHPFVDFNCRTFFISLNTLLTVKGLLWSFMYNPNRLDAYSQQELFEEITRGMKRNEYILQNQTSILQQYEKNDRTEFEMLAIKILPAHLEQQFLKFKNKYDGEYKKIIEEFENFLKIQCAYFSQSISQLIETYKILSQGPEIKFHEEQTINEFKIMLQALTDLEKDKNIFSFQTKLEPYKNNKKISEDILKIFQLSLMAHSMLSQNQTSPYQFIL